MTAVAVGKEKLIAAHGLGVGDATRLIVLAAEQRGYSVAATGPGQFRMIRQARPTWATVAAIVGFPFLGLGLLFLLVKKTDEGSVAVFEERDGTKVRLVGSIDESVAEVLTDGGALKGSNGAEPKRTKTSELPESQPTALSDVDRHTANSSPSHRPVSQHGSEALIDSSPWGKRPADFRPLSDDDIGKTVARPRVRSNGSALGLRFPDGQVVPLASGIVVGRSPRVPEGKSQAIAVAYPDNEMSKTHMIVERSGTTISVTDLHSTNGTAVAQNGNLLRCEPGEKVTMMATSTIHAGSSQISVVELP